ncbi:MAG: hypothetical protein P5702_22065 [Limnospira sp. PMC 1291.21]|uniref:Uncharacterized protein n=2 Tax=Limnospira TaxID=2596745 RepID=B5W7B7_LIMMA|nr:MULTISPECIES: hypothetical protein [unclassified Limnospira]EDZ92604.1 hypothetical protein AmaxDRAFT_4667 [Limnospira maxima CS-328]EKD06865.1 hypothetical protein SPLC1_S521000 [Arthrospira platensis C1]MDT9190513.1 hypothetical protein [Limnospira sp. PMC 894.15]MDT9236403.1 hypothetical protein [Limnospira sp. PMC 917.15]MDT9262050.1 hypothetical protein [Limnospira sp. PMC 1236.20]MDT9307953.1 hypothetical protein [Limnospira sp. PMC 1291.21]MDT9323306.1 hypothetical protein [Limnosp
MAAAVAEHPEPLPELVPISGLLTKTSFYLESDGYQPTAEDFTGFYLGLRGSAQIGGGIFVHPLPYRQTQPNSSTKIRFPYRILAKSDPYLQAKKNSKPGDYRIDIIPKTSRYAIVFEFKAGATAGQSVTARLTLGIFQVNCWLRVTGL